MKTLFAILALLCGDSLATQKPNVLLILADDLGYGDVHCYNPERGKIPTPHMDALAKSGMRFTDAHTSSGVCSPTRYALLTGRYHWRTRLQAGIVGYLENRRSDDPCAWRKVWQCFHRRSAFLWL